MNPRKKQMIRITAVVLFNLCIIMMVTFALTSKHPADPGAVATLSRVGSQGEEVRQIQQALANKGYSPGAADGIYGEGTAEAVRRFQKDTGLSADGIAGPATLRALGIGGNDTGGTTSNETAGGALSGVYKEGSTGEGVRQIQQVLADLGYYTGAVDGAFGSGTTHAVKAFQKSKGLSADGVVGASTLKSLGLGGSSTAGGISDSDYQLLARLVSAEARGEPYEGQVAVAAVILNRVEHPSFPDSISGVAYQPGAFTAMTDGQINEAVAESSLRAAKEALNGSDPSGGAIYYYNPAKTSNKWIRSRPVIKTIGLHVFCT